MYMAKRSATSDGSRKIRAAAYGVLQVTTFNPQSCILYYLLHFGAKISLICVLFAAFLN